MKTFWIRTASATVYALLFVGSIYSGRMIGSQDWGIVILTAFALFVALGCTFEYYRIATMHNHQPNKALGYFFTTCMVLGMGLLPLNGPSEEIGWAISIALGCILFVSLPVTLIVQLWRNSEKPFGDALHTLLPTAYCALPLGLMPLLHYEFNILMMCIIMVWVNDCFAYMGGSLVGKHKMWAKHSPGKTWEGTAIGLLACVATGLFVGPLFGTEYLDTDPWPLWLVLALVCSVIGTLGDLVESMLKRSVGLKDSGNIMPGHGGFLDRFDSLLAILPFAFLTILCLPFIIQ
ncbi:MAG: phosphatidate cytidylyltransferase [Bacteroidales bacterium]|nr:phosphatidate cytidylyltransferase [Bacteroidales bacterium]